MNAKDPIDTPEKLEAAYHELIPISRHMGIGVKSWNGSSLVLTAPLSENINHQGSGFGGSLFSAAALAGWGILQLALSRLGTPSNTVLANTDVGFKRPVFEDFECVCDLPDTWASVAETLGNTGRASLILNPRIIAHGETAMTLSGRYVITLTND